MATAYGTRPSSLLGYDATLWVAWQFDAAVLTFGRIVEGLMSERDKRGRPVHKLANLLKPYQERQRNDGQFLRGMVSRKVKVKPDGTWD